MTLQPHASERLRRLTQAVVNGEKTITNHGIVFSTVCACPDARSRKCVPSKVSNSASSFRSFLPRIAAGFCSLNRSSSLAQKVLGDAAGRENGHMSHAHLFHCQYVHYLYNVSFLPCLCCGAFSLHTTLRLVFASLQPQWHLDKGFGHYQSWYVSFCRAFLAYLMPYCHHDARLNFSPASASFHQRMQKITTWTHSTNSKRRRGRLDGESSLRHGYKHCHRNGCLCPSGLGLNRSPSISLRISLPFFPHHPPH
jgi:hypothetical protein